MFLGFVFLSVVFSVFFAVCVFGMWVMCVCLFFW